MIGVAKRLLRLETRICALMKPFAFSRDTRRATRVVRASTVCSDHSAAIVARVRKEGVMVLLRA